MNLSPFNSKGISLDRKSSGVAPVKRKLNLVSAHMESERKSLQKDFEDVLNIDHVILETALETKEEKNSADLERLISLLKEKL